MSKNIAIFNFKLSTDDMAQIAKLETGTSRLRLNAQADTARFDKGRPQGASTIKTTRPELELERLLAPLERDLLDATDEEIYAVAGALGVKPGMKGSIALMGVTRMVRLKPRDNNRTKRNSVTKDDSSTTKSRRRPKGDGPPSG